MAIEGVGVCLAEVAKRVRNYVGIDLEFGYVVLRRVGQEGNIFGLGLMGFR